MARILAVDDQPHMTCIIARWLARQGHEVVRADDGRAALELLRSQPFDILVSDVDMPGMDGLSLVAQGDVTARLRAVILITGRHDYRQLRPNCRAALHVLPKPFSPNRLAQLIEEILENESPGEQRQLQPHARRLCPAT
jgi:DNA-binding NtrC family response regulator